MVMLKHPSLSPTCYHKKACQKEKKFKLYNCPGTRSPNAIAHANNFVAMPCDDVVSCLALLCLAVPERELTLMVMEINIQIRRNATSPA